MLQVLGFNETSIHSRSNHNKGLGSRMMHVGDLISRARILAFYSSLGVSFFSSGGTTTALTSSVSKIQQQLKGCLPTHNCHKRTFHICSNFLPLTIVSDRRLPVIHQPCALEYSPLGPVYLKNGMIATHDPYSFCITTSERPSLCIMTSERLALRSLISRCAGHRPRVILRPGPFVEGRNRPAGWLEAILMVHFFFSCLCSALLT